MPSHVRWEWIPATKKQVRCLEFAEVERVNVYAV
jgi:hypothetical protein